MITEEKLKIFLYYKGDVDAFGHGRRSDKRKVSDADFYLINNLLADIHLIKRGLASKEYAEETELRLKENCDNITTIEELKRISLLELP
jgi:hypothetical protein